MKESGACDLVEAHSKLSSMLERAEKLRGQLLLQVAVVGDADTVKDLGDTTKLILKTTRAMMIVEDEIFTRLHASFVAYNKALESVDGVMADEVAERYASEIAVQNLIGGCDGGVA